MQTHEVVERARAPSDASDEVSLDATWEWLVERRSPRERSATRVLPYRLGITWRPNGTWLDFVHHQPVFDLPAWMAEAVDCAIDARALTLFRRAHHCATFFGILSDRVADGLVRADRALDRESTWLRREWESALALACVSGARASRHIADARRSWLDGARSAREWLSSQTQRAQAPSLSAQTCAAMIAKRVEYLWVSSGAMLHQFAIDAARTSALRVAFDRTLLALHLHEDAVESDDAHTIRGPNIAEALRLDEATMRATSALLLRSVTQIPVSTRYDEWCRTTANRVQSALTLDEASPTTARAMALVRAMTGAAP